MSFKIKVLHLIDSITTGGAEKLLSNTIAELTDYEHLVVTVFDSGDISLLPDGIESISLDAGTRAGLMLKKNVYRKIIRKFKPDIVHSHLYFATIFAKAFTPSSVPLIFTQHFEFSKNASKWYYRFLDKMLSNKKHICIAVSNTVLRDYIVSTGFKGRTLVIGNYIPDKYFQLCCDNNFEKTGELKLVALGNIKPIKNQRYILNAFTFLSDLNVTCDVYGEGSERTDLEKEARANDLNLYFKGMVYDSSKVLPLYDLYLMPSLTEGFPLALFEAMAVGLPALVSDIPVFHELLGDQAKYLPLNNPLALRKCIEYYLNNPEKIKTDGLEAKEFAAVKASKQVYLEKIRKLYKTVLIEQFDKEFVT